MAERDLQDEVERILRRLTLEEIKAVATHLEIPDMDDAENTRPVLRSVQDQFDNAADAEARNALLRGLPIPEPHTANYQLLLAPEPDQVVPNAPVINNAAPVNGGLDGGHGQAVGQNGGAPDGGDNHVGQQGGGPPVGGLGGLNGAQAVNGVNNDAFAQQNMAQNFGGFQNQNVAGFGVQRPQIGGFQQQNPWGFGGMQQLYGAQNFGMFHPQNIHHGVFYCFIY